MTKPRCTCTLQDIADQVVDELHEDDCARYLDAAVVPTHTNQRLYEIDAETLEPPVPRGADPPD